MTSLNIEGHQNNRLMILMDSFDFSIQTQLTRINPLKHRQYLQLLFQLRYEENTYRNITEVHWDDLLILTSKIFLIHFHCNVVERKK